MSGAVIGWILDTYRFLQRAARCEIRQISGMLLLWLWGRAWTDQVWIFMIFTKREMRVVQRKFPQTPVSLAVFCVECSMQNLNTIRTAMHSWVKMGQALSPSKPGCVLDDEEVAGWWILLQRGIGSYHPMEGVIIRLHVTRKDSQSILVY